MLRLMSPIGTVEWKYIAVDFYVEGTERIIDADVEATCAHASARMAATLSDRLSVSTDGGANYTPLGTDITTGVDLGAFTPGQRKAVRIKLYVTPGTGMREQSVGVQLGVGT